MLWILIFTTYQLFQILLLPLFIPYAIAKNLYAPNSSTIISEQTGFVPLSNDLTKNTIWIHGLSTGEISAAQELIKTIKQEISDCACYVTAGTEEGKKTAIAQQIADYVSLLPHDDIISTACAFSRINPRAIILLEHEICPSIIMLARMKNIPVYLVNAQYTTITKQNFVSYKFLYQPLLNSLSTIFAQSENDQKAFIDEGIDHNKIHAIGNIKAYNVMPKYRASLEEVKDFLTSYQHKKERPLILLVGSVHQGEIDYYLSLMKELKPRIPNLKIIFAPRFFTWKDELVRKVKELDYPYYLMDANEQCSQNPADMLATITNNILVGNDILMVCLMGKLFYLHAIADLYCLGGTFVPVGGHNLFEPTAWGNPTILGPQYENTKDIADELKKLNAVIQVSTEQELIENAHKLLSNRQQRNTLAQRAKSWLDNEAARVTTNIKILLDELKQSISLQENLG